MWAKARFFLGIGIASVLILAPLYAVSAEELDYFDLQPDELLNAEVLSVSKKLETVADAAAAIYVITQEDIQRSGVTSIPEALRMAPGVNVARADGNSWAISIRGFNGTLANKLLVMIDGRSVYNPLFAGTYWELQDYMLADIERIEVIRGPGGSLWGANAVNGVINIITKNAHETQGNLVTALAGTHERGIVSVRHGGNFGPGQNYRVYGKYYDRNAFRRPGGGDATDEWQGGRSGFRMDWGDNFTVQGDIYRVLADQINSTPLTASPFALIEEEAMGSQGANILGRMKKDMRSGALWTVQAYLDYTDRDQILLRDKRAIMDIETQYNFVGTGRHEMIAGAGYRYTHDDLENAPSVVFTPASRSDNLFNFYVQDKIALSPDKLYLTLGSKFEHNDYTGFEVQPNIRLQYHPDSSQTVWTAVSRAVRTPSRLEHDLTQTLTVTGGTVFILQANRNFDSEILVAYEAGYRKQINPALSIDVAAFYNDYEDLATVGFLPLSGSEFPIEAVNGMKAQAYGAEITSSWNVSSSLKLSGSYSLLNLDTSVDEDGGFDLESGTEESSPHHQANIRASWNMTDSLSLDTSAYYVDQLASSDVKGYVRLDMNLGWKINDQVRFNLTAQNLLDDSHREFSAPSSLNATEIERSVFGKLTWQF